MSYSRWSESELYTLWADNYSRNRDDQVFLCHVSMAEEHSVTYKELKAIGVFACAHKMLKASHPNDEALHAELCGYLNEFILDVETDLIEANDNDGTKPMSVWTLAAIGVLGLMIVVWTILWSESKRFVRYLLTKVKRDA